MNSRRDERRARVTTHLRAAWGLLVLVLVFLVVVIVCGFWGLAHTHSCQSVTTACLATPNTS